MRFEEYCEMRDFNYVSIGHDFEGRFDSWVLKRGASDIKVAPSDPEFFHDDQRNLDFKGRVDHDKKMVSVVAGTGDDDRLQYLVSILKSDYPGYTIWLFSHSLPKRLA